MAWFENGGSRVYFEEAGNGDPVLLLPGTDSIAHYGAFRTQLAGRFRVIAADLPGSGRSGPQPRSYHPGYYREDAEVMLALLASRVPGPVHVLGFSDDGEVAINMAPLAFERVRSVVTWGSSGVINDPEDVALSVFRNVFDDPAPGVEAYRSYLLAAYGAETARAMLKSFVATAEQIIAAGGDIGFDAADRITCPVLLVMGDRDGFVQRADVMALAERIPKGRMVIAPNAGHGVHEDQPEWFLQTVAQWLTPA